MNKAAFAHFLRHLLFFCVILTFIVGIIIMDESYSTEVQLINDDIFPLNMRAPRHSVYIAIDIVIEVSYYNGVYLLIASLIGFFGAMYLYRYPLINFTAGMTFLILVIGQLVVGITMPSVVSAFDTLIIANFERAFNASNYYNKTIEDLLPPQWQNPFFKTQMPNIWGWNPTVAGTEDDHDKVDYFQTNMQCCGLNGRLSWKVRIPSSCCPFNVSANRCALDVAYTKPCLYRYHKFRASLVGVESQCYVAIFLSTAVIICCFKLAHLQQKYPNENYDSESSEESDEY